LTDLHLFRVTKLWIFFLDWISAAEGRLMSESGQNMKLIP